MSESESVPEKMTEPTLPIDKDAMQVDSNLESPETSKVPNDDDSNFVMKTSLKELLQKIIVSVAF